MKRLYRSRQERNLAGILGGMGLYLGVDPVFIRVVAIFVMIVTGVLPFLIAYGIAYFIIPMEPEHKD